MHFLLLPLVLQRFSNLDAAVEYLVSPICVCMYVRVCSPINFLIPSKIARALPFFFLHSKFSYVHIFLLFVVSTVLENLLMKDEIAAE